MRVSLAIHRYDIDEALNSEFLYNFEDENTNNIQTFQDNINIVKIIRFLRSLV